MPKEGLAATLGLLILLALPGMAAAVTTYYGCFTCDAVGIVGMGGRCQSVPYNSWGDGWKCFEDESFGLGFPNDPMCWTNQEQCYHILAGGGGGGGGGTGGGGSTCQNSTGFCPAECFTCGGGGAYGN